MTWPKFWRYFGCAWIGWFAALTLVSMTDNPEAPEIVTVEGPTVTSIVTETVTREVTPEACLRLPDSLAIYFQAESDAWAAAADAQLGGPIAPLERASERQQAALDDHVMPDLAECVQGKTVDLKW